jgi:hypothetical protein
MYSWAANGQAESRRWQPGRTCPADLWHAVCTVLVISLPYPSLDADFISAKEPIQSLKQALVASGLM